jgi:hypothetical protein
VTLALLLLLGSFSLLPGCVGSGEYHDREKPQNGNYHSGALLPRGGGSLAEANQYRHRDPRGGDAAYGLLVSAFSLAQNPEYYRKSSIGGRCFTGPTESTALQLPCLNVTYVLTDESGKETARQQSESGSFKFFVEPNKTYFVSVLSHEKLREKSGPVRMGDEIVIRLGASETQNK